MKKLIAAVTIAFWAATGCQEEAFDNTTSPDNTFRASSEVFGTGTRTALSETNQVVWSEEDKIAIFDGSVAGQAYQIIDSYAGGSTGEFSLMEGLVTTGSSDDMENIVAIYPFTEQLGVSSTEDAEYEITGISFPTDQTYSEGSFSNGAFPMVALTAEGNRSLSFKNVGGVLKLTLIGQYAVSRITIKGHAGETLSGMAKVTVGSDGIPSVEMSPDAAETVNLICEPAVQLDPESGKDFYISIPPTAFEAGFTITVTDTDGNTYRKSTSVANPVLRSMILVMPETDLDTDIAYEATENYVDLGFGRTSDITSYDETSGSLSVLYSKGSIPRLREGNAIVLPAEYGGEVRLIDSYSVSDKTLNLETSQGNMCDLFKNTTFTLSTSEAPETRSAGVWDVITPSAYGYIDETGEYHELYNASTGTKSAEHPTYTNEKVFWSLESDFSGEELISNGPGKVWWEKFTMDAGLKGIFTFDFGEKKISEIRSVGDINFVRYELNGSFNSDMLLKMAYNRAYKDDDNILVMNNVIPAIQFTFMVGTVPVHMQVNTDLYCEYAVEIEGNVEVSSGIIMENSVMAGAEWTPGNGFKALYDSDSYMELYPATFQMDASASTKVSFYPHIGIKFYKLLGPWFEPKPYMAGEINAGLRASTDDTDYIGWKAETTTGLDYKVGMDVDFIIGEWSVGSEEINMEETTIFTAPARIQRLSPEDMTAVAKGETITAEFLVESYSEITNEYYPCPGALVNFSTENGTCSSEIAIADGNGIVTVEWTPDSSPATRAVSEHILKASIVDGKGEAIDEATLTVCIEEKEQWVDMGLSVMWAAWNVGASSPEEYGNYYAWGETDEKSVYSEETYNYAYKCLNDNVTNNPTWGFHWEYDSIGHDICETEYDAAHVNWGDGARLPRLSDIQELQEKCTFQVGLYNGMSGYYVTAPNGNSIFLPFSGYYDENGFQCGGERGYFWSGTIAGDDQNAYNLYSDATYNLYDIIDVNRFMGLTVRAVKVKVLDENEDAEIAFPDTDLPIIDIWGGSGD